MLNDIEIQQFGEIFHRLYGRVLSEVDMKHQAEMVYRLVKLIYEHKNMKMKGESYGNQTMVPGTGSRS